MSNILRVHIEEPISGWLPITVVANDATLSFVASHTPYDSLSDLVTNLIAIVRSDSGYRSVRWNTEPGEYEFQFTTEADSTLLTVIQWPDARRNREDSHNVLVIRESRNEIVRAFWRALRRLESQSTKMWNWQHPFPTSEMRKLEQNLQDVW